MDAEVGACDRCKREDFGNILDLHTRRIISNEGMACVALDMDETLGHFAQASLLWGATKNNMITLSSDDLVACLLEIPGLFNPDIMNIISVLRRGKGRGKVGQVVVYTNNIGDRNWPETVCKAINTIAGGHIIDDVIAGYRGQNDVNEPRRSTSHKTVSDLRHCVGDAPFYVFVDNEHHPGMVAPEVKYIRVVPHIVTLPVHAYDDAVERALGNRVATELKVSELVNVPRTPTTIGSAFSGKLAHALGIPARVRNKSRTRRTSKGGKRLKTRRA